MSLSERGWSPPLQCPTCGRGRYEHANDCVLREQLRAAQKARTAAHASLNEALPEARARLEATYDRDREAIAHEHQAAIKRIYEEAARD